MQLLNLYGQASGQFLSLEKCRFYASSMSSRRITEIGSFLGFLSGSLPFNNLGVPLFKGKPKVVYLQHIIDRIKQKLSSWKGSLLSILGKVQLVNSVIHDMLAYSFYIYVWPISLIKQVDGWIRNFIWSGDIHKRKYVTVAWKVCFPISDGGLDLRRIRSINEASMLKMCWDLISSSEQWAQLLKARFLKNLQPIHYRISSSIWPALRNWYSTVLQNIPWLIGDGKSVKFWTSRWPACTLVDLMQIHNAWHNLLSSTVKDFIINSSWSIPDCIQNHFPGIVADIQNIHFPIEPCEDQLVWLASVSGKLPFKEGYLFLNPVANSSLRFKQIWSQCVPPSRSFLAWRIFLDKMPKDENDRKIGCFTVSMCSLCGKAEGTTIIFPTVFICYGCLGLAECKTSICN